MRGTHLTADGETEAQIISIIYSRIYNWNNRVRTPTGST